MGQNIVTGHFLVKLLDCGQSYSNWWQKSIWPACDITNEVVLECIDTKEDEYTMLNICVFIYVDVVCLFECINSGEDEYVDYDICWLCGAPA